MAIHRSKTPGQYMNVHAEHNITVEEVTAHLSAIDSKLTPLLKERASVVADLTTLLALQQEDMAAAAQSEPEVQQPPAPETPTDEVQ